MRSQYSSLSYTIGCILTGDSCASPTDVSAFGGGSLLCLGSLLSVGTAGGLCSRCLVQWVCMPTLEGITGGNGQKMCWKVAVGLTPQPGFL